MDFESARTVLLYIAAHELYLEHTELAAENEDLEPDLDVYLDTVYEELAANNMRSLIAHLLDYTEEEVVHAATNIWESFT